MTRRWGQRRVIDFSSVRLDGVNDAQAINKAILRERMTALRDALPSEQRANWSHIICQRATALPEYQTARVVHCFLSIRNEVNTQPLIEHALAHGKRVVLPVFLRNSNETPCTEITSLNDDEFKVTGFGLRVPRVRRWVDLSEIDLVFTPLLAFAEMEPGRFYRLGYGAGFYDRLLSRVTAPKIGLAFAMQHVATLPVEAHDAALEDVVTEKIKPRRIARG
jgi:5-formyltetrahydrofolate cyclo-ligase